MSTDDQWPNDSYDDQFSREPEHGSPKPEKEGMGTAVKVILILVGIGGVSLLLCCGIGVWFMSRSMEMVEVAEDVEALSQEIVEIDVPEDFNPMGGMKMDMFGMISAKMAFYQAEPVQGALFLMEMNVAGAPPADMEVQMRQQMDQQDFGEAVRDLKVVKSETRDFEILDQTVSFKFDEAKDPVSEEDFRQVTGSFQGKNGFVMLIYQIHADEYDEDEVLKMIQSIR